VVGQATQGQDIKLLDAFYVGLRTTLEVTMATVLSAISWGWLLNSPSLRRHYLFIILLVTSLNVITLVIGGTDTNEGSTEHLYQGLNGKIILFIRILISLIFLSGSLWVSLQSTP
jgi:hypothetical protein